MDVDIHEETCMEVDAELEGEEQGGEENVPVIVPEYLAVLNLLGVDVTDPDQQMQAVKLLIAKHFFMDIAQNVQEVSRLVRLEIIFMIWRHINTLIINYNYYY
jgi:hypothetical protein